MGTHVVLNAMDKDHCSSLFDRILKEWRRTDAFVSLRGWRDEQLAIRHNFSSPSLFYVDRSGCSVFGFKTYSVHVNGYMRQENGDVCMWIARRSATKQTYPNQLDNTVAGQIAADDSVMATVIKECEEEAHIPRSLASHARPTGSVCYIKETERGIRPETIFVYDLELPPSFQPHTNDDEVSDFYLVSIEEVKEMIASSEFKADSALCVVDFLLRWGFIEPDTEPNYVHLVQSLRR